MSSNTPDPSPDDTTGTGTEPTAEMRPHDDTRVMPAEPMWGAAPASEPAVSTEPPPSADPAASADPAVAPAPPELVTMPAPTGPHLPAIILGLVCLAVAGLAIAQEMFAVDVDWSSVG